MREEGVAGYFRDRGMGRLGAGSAKVGEEGGIGEKEYARRRVGTARVGGLDEV